MHYSVPRPGVRVTHELRRKNSRFLTVLTRAESPETAQDLLAETRRAHRDAAHHCSAWLIGHDRRIQRANDDGEPSGTAGAPMLEALARAEIHHAEQNLSDVVAVVTRWFGGTLLGTGGLVSAYSDAVVAVLDQAQRENAFVLRRRMRVLGVPAPIAEAGRWENELRNVGAMVLETDYLSLNGTALLRVAVTDTGEGVERMAALAASLQGDAVSLEDHGVEWTDQETKGYS